MNYKSAQTTINKAGNEKQYKYGRFPVYLEDGRRTTVSIPVDVYDLLVAEVGIERLKKMVRKFGQETPVGERSKHVFRRILEVLKGSINSDKLARLVNKVIGD